jgi:hypothetical protein
MSRVIVHTRDGRTLRGRRRFSLRFVLRGAELLTAAAEQPQKLEGAVVIPAPTLR